MSGLFQGSFAVYYDRYLVPMNFLPYARVMAARAAALSPRHVLETAAGTGVVTLELVRTLPPDVSIVATDLNQPMIDHARVKPGLEQVTWQQADAGKLPFLDAGFDLVISQFGVMFFPDKAAAFNETWRVLRPGGTFLFDIWDDYHAMPDHFLTIAAGITGDILGRDAMSLLSPPYHDRTAIQTDLAAAGFTGVRIEPIARPSLAASARDAAMVVVQGSVLRTAIEAAAPTRMQEITDMTERAIAARFGTGPVAGETKALIVSAERPLA